MNMAERTLTNRVSLAIGSALALGLMACGCYALSLWFIPDKDPWVWVAGYLFFSAVRSEWGADRYEPDDTQ